MLETQYEIKEMDRRMDIIEKRMDRIENRMERLEDKINRLENEINSFNRKSSTSNLTIWEKVHIGTVGLLAFTVIYSVLTK